MDTNPRRGRGRARGQRPLTQTQNQQNPCPQSQNTFRPSQQYVPRPQTQSQNIRPISSGRIPQSSVQVSRNQDTISSQVEQVVRSVRNLTTDDIPPALGRGTVRGRRELQRFIVPRPESSLLSKSGTSGSKIVVKTNYFPISHYPTWNLYQYRVDFNPPEDRISIQRALLFLHEKKLGTFIFDGTMLFSVQNYQSKKFELISKRNTDDQIVKITVSFSKTVERNDDCVIQIYNLIVRNSMRHLDLVQLKRHFYDPKCRVDINQHNLQIWPGYETAIGIFDSGLLLKAEISTKIMRIDTVLSILQECYRTGRTKENLDRFKASVIGSIVLTKYSNKTYRIDDVNDDITDKSSFQMKDGTSITYVDYYLKKYNIKTTCTQPLLLSKIKKAFRSKDEEELIYLIPEFCTLTGLSESMRKNFSLMRDLAEYTQVFPKKRVEKYNAFMARLQTTPKSINEFKNWDLTLEKDLIDVTGRVLPRQILYCNDKTRQYTAGPNSDWAGNVRSLPMFTCVKTTSWVVLCPKAVSDNLSSFVRDLKLVASGMKFELPMPDIVIMNRWNAIDYSKELEMLINQKNPALILVVIMNTRQDLYNVIKRKLCVDRAVPSQVVQSKHLIKLNKSVNTKIAIQINCKLGGTPWHVSVPPNMMIVGYDVCHDKQNKNISYGAYVASLNPDSSKYFSCVERHRSGEEVSCQFGMNITRALNKYKEKNNKLPGSIVVYRDGVGDGQIQYVYENEVQQLKKACEAIYKYVPPLAFIIVKKRISTRFFVQKNKTSDHYENPPPGTVIDSTVTDPNMYDFFLVSQHSLRGTVTPTHYNIIEDTLNNWSPDKMQKLTYALTHMYYNWTGTVRVPSVCQMAHKLAFFTSQTLQTMPNAGLNELLYFL